MTLVHPSTVTVGYTPDFFLYSTNITRLQDLVVGFKNRSEVPLRLPVKKAWSYI